MDALDNMYQQLAAAGVPVIDCPFTFSNGETRSATLHLNSGPWGIFIDRSRCETRAEETVAIYHESGHFATGTTHEVSSPSDLIAKHEYKANKWAIRKMIPQANLEAAVSAGYTEVWELAELFGVTEDFMAAAMCWYQYGRMEL